MKLLGWTLLVLCVWALGATLAWAEDADRAACVQEQDRDRSIRACTEILARGNAESPQNRAVAYTCRGNAYQAKDDFERAISDYDQAIRLDPKFAVAYTGRGVAYDRKNDHDRAIADYDEAIRLDSQYAIAYNNRGNAYFAKGDFERAIADYDQAIRLDPKFADALGNRGLAFERRGDAARARADFEAALAARPGDGMATAGLGRLGGSAAPTVDDSAPEEELTWVCSPGKRVALVIGNSSYPGPARLVNSVNDADDVSGLLRDNLCFNVIEVKDATRETFSRKIAEFAETANGAEVALFYYAGHGMQFQQTNYLLPVDSQMANEYDAIHSNISAQDLIAMLEARAKVTLVFLDAGHNNPIEEDFKRRMASLGRGFGETRGLAPMTSQSSETLIVFATRPNERADDGTGRNSPFTEAFLAHIGMPGTDIEVIMRYVTETVNAKTNGRQTPQRLTQLKHGLTLLPAPWRDVR